MIGYMIASALGILVAILVIRALMFRPRRAKPVARENIAFNQKAAVDSLARLVQCKTVSYNDPSIEDEAEFNKLTDLLKQLYPEVFRVCTLQTMPGRALLLRWPGRSSAAPSVMMSHYDVVPADEQQWEKPPFSGIVEDGVLWGRGTLDTKATLNGALFAANHLIKASFMPENDIYFAFSGGEEVNGEGAVNIVKYFTENNIQPALVLDEGGAVVENVFPGVEKPCGMIGIAEKGMINVSYSVVSGGGHASAPPVRTPITTLAKACQNILRRPFPMRITKPTQELFNTLGRHSSFLYRLIFANLWLFSPVLDLICRASGGELNALVRTTTAFTQMQGSNARNVLPTRAELISNMRLSPADTVASAVKHLHKAVNDKNVSIHILESCEPSPVSETGCAAWEKVASSVEQTWPGCIVSPYLMVQCSDSRHYRDLSRNVYRFSGMDLTGQERKSIHGNNEKIRLETICRCVEFYIRLLQKC